MEDKIHNMLVSILNHCFSMTNIIPKYLNDPMNPEIMKLCKDLSVMLKEYLDEADKNS